MVLSLLVGAASGVIGAAWTTAYVSDYAASLGSAVSPLRAPRSPASPAFADIRDQAFASTAQLYAARTDAPDPFHADRQGIVLTSDGWILASDPGRPLLTALIGRRVYAVQREIPDAVSETVFLKVDAQDLSPVGFGDAFGVQAGDEGELLDGRGSFRRATVISVTRPADYASDRPARRIATDAPASSAGAPWFGGTGNFLGFVSADATLSPVNGMLPAVRSVLADQTVKRASLGVTAADLSQILLPAASPSSAPNVGARVLSVAKGSAAEAAGVRVGDVFLAWDGRTVDAAHPLDELLLGDAPKQTVAAALQRGAAQMDVTLVLP